MKPNSKRGKTNRRKGHQFERDVAKLFRRWFPEARRGLQYRDGRECCDVEGTPYWIECKRRKKIGWRALESIFKKIESDGRPVILISKCDHQPIIINLSKEADEILFPNATVRCNGQQVSRFLFEKRMDRKHGVSSRPTKKGE